MRILIIDDDLKTIEGLELRFKRSHHTLEWRTFIEDEKTLRETLESFDPDGIVVDFQMPRTSGGEVYRWIRHWREDVPVVFYTKYGLSPDVRLKMNQAGAPAHMIVSKSSVGRDAGLLLKLLERS